MEQYIVLYNPRSGNGKGLKIAYEIAPLMGNAKLEYRDMTLLKDFDTFVGDLPENTGIILTGGDGTLNSFINKVDCDSLKHKVYFYASGSGNDFARDIGLKKQTEPVCIDKYLKNLPCVSVNGKEYKFINCVGSGMDGYCCHEVERLRKASKKRANYTLVAIKALLYAYRPSTAEVEVDGVKHKFKNMWLVPTMNGKYFGGGFMAAPKQDRLDKSHSISIVAMHSKNIFQIILAFLLIFKGKHTILKNMITVIEGHNVSVKLDRAAPLQIDGETIPNVSEYRVRTAKDKQLV